VPSFLKNTAGGKAISGGALQPRGRRGNTAQVASYWAGGVEELGSYESIVTYSNINGLNTVTFSSIPQTYKHLQIRTSTVATTDGYIESRFNSDSGSNYAWHILTGEGSATGASAQTSQTKLRITAFNNQMDTTNPYVSITDILDYTNTNKYTTIRTLSGKDSNGAGDINLISGVWLNSAALTSIELFLSPTSAKTYLTGSHIALYGIKG
jgi:hypothetical protein